MASASDHFVNEIVHGHSKYEQMRLENIALKQLLMHKDEKIAFLKQSLKTAKQKVETTNNEIRDLKSKHLTNLSQILTYASQYKDQPSFNAAINNDTIPRKDRVYPPLPEVPVSFSEEESESPPPPDEPYPDSDTSF